MVLAVDLHWPFANVIYLVASSTLVVLGACGCKHVVTAPSCWKVWVRYDLLFPPLLATCSRDTIVVHSIDHLYLGCPGGL